MSITKKLGLLKLATLATVLAPATALASEGAASGDSSKGLMNGIRKFRHGYVANLKNSSSRRFWPSAATHAG